MSSYSQKRQSRRGKQQHSDGGQGSSRQEPNKKTGKPDNINPENPMDLDRLSRVGSITSDMSTSILEKRLLNAQTRIGQLESITQKQQDTIDKLMSLLNSRHKKC
jgi:hypothetical protein